MHIPFVVLLIIVVFALIEENPTILIIAGVLLVGLLLYLFLPRHPKH